MSKEMNLGDIFKELKLDTWYKFVMVAGVIGFVIAITAEVKAITNVQLATLSGGMFCFGLGRWKCERYDISIMGTNIEFGGNVLQLTEARFAFDILGYILMLIGIILFGGFVSGLLNTPPSAVTLTATPPAANAVTPTVQATSTLVISPTP